jgi:hypothetical protein
LRPVCGQGVAGPKPNRQPAGSGARRCRPLVGRRWPFRHISGMLDGMIPIEESRQ